MWKTTSGRAGDGGADRRGVGDVAAVAAGEAGHLGAEGAQPERQPASLEARVAGDQHTPPGPERRVGQGTRHAVTLCDDPRIATVRILGAGGWIPTGTHATCSALLRDGDAAVLIDAGSGVERLVADPSLLDGVERLELVLTHFHLDHVVGLAYLPGLRGAGGIPPRIWGPAQALFGSSSDEALRRIYSPPFYDADYGLVATRGARAGEGAADRAVHAHHAAAARPQHADAGAALRRPLHLLHRHALRRGQRRARGGHAAC